jgi:hypothetical protein
LIQIYSGCGRLFRVATECSEHGARYLNGGGRDAHPTAVAAECAGDSARYTDMVIAGGDIAMCLCAPTTGNLFSTPDSEWSKIAAVV